MNEKNELMENRGMDKFIQERKKKKRTRKKEQEQIEKVSEIKLDSALNK